MSSYREWDLCPMCCIPVRPTKTNNGIADVYHVVHCGWGHEMGEPQMTEEQAWKASAITLRAVLKELTGEMVSSLVCLRTAESMLSLIRHLGIRPALSEDTSAPDKNSILEVEVSIGRLLKRWESIARVEVREVGRKKVSK